MQKWYITFWIVQFFWYQETNDNPNHKIGLSFNSSKGWFWSYALGIPQDSIWSSMLFSFLHRAIWDCKLRFSHIHSAHFFQIQENTTIICFVHNHGLHLLDLNPTFSPMGTKSRLHGNLSSFFPYKNLMNLQERATHPVAQWITMAKDELESEPSLS